MGIEWALADDGNKHLFELGKGNWHRLLFLYGADIDAWSEHGPDDMAERAVEMWHDMYAEQGEEIDAYVADIGRRIYHFAEHAGWKNLSLVNNTDDSWFECDQAGYDVVDSRYVQEHKAPGWTMTGRQKFAMFVQMVRRWFSRD